MTPEFAFLRALQESPDDRVTYAVLADWLEERGDVRAELVRALLALRDGATTPAQVQALLDGRVAGRLRRLKGVGAVSLDPDGVLSLRPHGIPGDSVELPADEWSWVTEVVASRLGVLRGLHRLTDRLPHLRRVRVRFVAGNFAPWCRALRECPRRPLDWHVEVEGEPLSPVDLRVLGQAFPPGLRGLSLSRCSLGDAGIQTLVRLPGLKELRRLDLGDNGIWEAGVQALAGAANLANLEVLSLRGNPLGDAGASALAGSPHLGRLRRLVLSRGYLGSADPGSPIAAMRARFAEVTFVA